MNSRKSIMRTVIIHHANGALESWVSRCLAALALIVQKNVCERFPARPGKLCLFWVVGSPTHARGTDFACSLGLTHA